MAFNLGTAEARITLDASDLFGTAKQVESTLSGLDGAVGRASGGFSKFQNVLAKIGTAFIAPVIAGVKTAATIEQAMASVNASLGGLDTSVLQELEQGFLDIGAASQYSAADVAMVGDELAKAGFDPERIIGVTRAVVDLSQATGEGLGPATEGMIQAMAMWSEEVVGTELAITDASRAADIFTIAANASAGGVGDIIGGLRNAGPALAGMQVSFEDSAAAIALFTNYGYSGNEIGTKLSRTLTQLAKPTADAAAEMEKYGIVAFDTEGKFIGFPALFDQLQTGFAGVGDEVKLAALKTIFGAEAFDLMNIAVATGGDPLRELEKLFGQTGVAAEQSALRMDTLKAQFGELTESVSNLLGRMMSGILPVLRAVVDAANLVVNAISKIPQPILAAVGAVMALAAAFATLRGAAAGLSVLSNLTGMAVPGGALFGGLGTALLAVAAAAAVAYVAIRFNLFGIRDAIDAFRDSWRALGNLGTADNPIAKFLISLGAALRSFDIGALNTIAAGLGTFGVAVESFFDAFGVGGENDLKTNIDVTGDDKLIEWVTDPETGEIDYKVRVKNPDGSLGEFGEIIESYTDEDDPNIAHIKIKTDDGEYWTTVKKDTGVVGEGTIEVNVDGKSEKDTRKTIDRIQDGLDAMTASLEQSDYPWLAQFPRAASRAIDSIRTFTEGFRMARELGADPLEASLRALGTTIPQLSNVTAQLEMGWRDMKDTFQTFRDQGLGPVGAGLRTLGETFPSLRTAMDGLAQVTDGLGNAFQAALRGDWAAAFVGLRDAASGAWDVIQEVASGIGGLVVDLWNWTINTGVPAVTGWLADNAGDIWSGITAAAGWVWDGLVQVGSITLQVAGWLIQSAQSAWEAIKNWVLGHAGAGVSGAGLGTGGNLAAMTGNSIPIGTVAVVIGGWIVSAAENLIEKIDTFIFGEAGDREFTIPVINVTVGRVNVLPFGDKIQEGIDTAVRVWQTAQAVHADIEQINARVNSAKVEGGDGGGGFIGYLQDEIQKEIDHASKTWKFIVDLSIVAQAEVENPDSTYNHVVGLLERMAGGWGMIHGGKVDWGFVLGEPKILGFGLLDAATWFDQHIYRPVERGFNSIKDKFTFDMPDIDINWPDPPDAPAWLEKLFTDPVGWIKEQVGFGGSGDGGNGVMGPVVPEGFKWQGTLIDFGPGEGPTLEELKGVIQSIMGKGQGMVTGAAAGWAASIPPINVQVQANTDQAMSAITAVQNAMTAVNGQASTVQVLGDNAGALAAVDGAAGALGGIAGRTAQTFVNGDNSNALGAVMGAAAAIGGFDGTTGTAYLNAVDNVSGAVSSALAAVRSMDGATATAYLNVVTTGGAGLGGRIPGRATGGVVREPLTLVGERGPELVSLPYGSYVNTANRTQQVLGGGGGGNTYIHVETNVAGHAVGVSDLANEIAGPVLQKIASVKQRRDLAKGVAR